MHILLFGGSFNPPHLGHLLVIEQALELIPSIDQLWLMPTTMNPIVNKSSTSAEIRLELCHLLVKEIANPKVQVSSFEIDHHSNGSTFDTLQLLKANYPTYQFSFLVGSDQLPVFTQWKQWERLLQEMTFYVYPRAGFPMEPLYPTMVALESPTQVITNISSTLIRKRLHAKLTTTNILPNNILHYIEENNLYVHY